MEAKKVIFTDTDIGRLGEYLSPGLKPPQEKPVLRGEFDASMEGIHSKVDSIASDMGDIAVEVRRMSGTQQTMAHTQQQMLELQRRDREIAQRLENHIESSNRSFDRQEREFGRVVKEQSAPGKNAMAWIDRWKQRLWIPIMIIGFVSAAAVNMIFGIIHDMAKAKITHAVAVVDPPPRRYEPPPAPAAVEAGASSLMSLP
jgi:hypothetical protein